MSYLLYAIIMEANRLLHMKCVHMFFSMRVYVMCMCLCMYAPTHQTLAFAYNYAAFGYQAQLIQLVDIYESGIRWQAV